MFDVVTKPMEGAKKDGFWGFAQGAVVLFPPALQDCRVFARCDQIWLLAENVRCRGLTKGVAGTIVKPVAAIGTAIGEARPLWNLEATAQCR